MSTRSPVSPSPGRAKAARRHALFLVCGTLALTGTTQAVSASGAPARDRATKQSLRGLSRAATTSPGASATLEQCVTAADQSGRSATFSGQMTTVVGAQRMAMRIELEEHTRGSGPFRVVVAPGLGVWRGSEAGVKIYKYIKQVTNLAAPAVYRALVRFRWTTSKGRVVRLQTLRTQVCKQPAHTTTGPESTTTTTTTTTVAST